MYELQILIAENTWKTIAKKWNGEVGRDELIRKGIEELEIESWQVVAIQRVHSGVEKFNL